MKNYDSWKTTDPRDMEPPEKPERDPDAEYDAWRDEQLQHAHYKTQTVEELQAAHQLGAQAGVGATPAVPLDEIVGNVTASVIRRLEAEVTRLQKRSMALQAAVDVLQEVDEYLDDRVDINWEGTGPNKEMSLQTEVRAAIRKAEGR